MTPNTPAAGPAPVALPPLPRSSIAAVLAHRGELSLGDDQVRALASLEQTQLTADAEVRQQWAKRRDQASAAKPASGTGGGAAAPAMGGGRMGGGMRGGGMGGRGMRAGGAGAGADQRATAEDRLDDKVDENDTAAYLQAETLLSEPQRARARDIAEDYREQLYERRAAARQAAAAAKK